MVKVTLRTAAEHWYAYGETERNWKPSTRRDYPSRLSVERARSEYGFIGNPAADVERLRQTEPGALDF